MIERFILYAFLFAIPFQARLVLAHWSVVFNEWMSGFLWGTDILFCLLLVAWLVRRLRTGVPIAWSRGDLWLVAFWVIAGLSIFQADIPAISLYRFLKLTEYILFFFYLRGSIGTVISFSSASLAVIVSAFLQAGIGITQYVLQHDIGLRLLGESVLSIDGEAVAVVVAESQRFLRAYGTMPHPNVLAVWLMLGLWGSSWYFMYGPHRIVRRFVIIAMPILIIAFFLTFSRIASILLIVSSFVFFRKQFIRVLAPLAVLVAVLSIIFFPQLQSRFMLTVRDEAVAQRIFHAKIALAQIWENPLFGIGIGQFVPDLMRRLPHYPDTIYQPAHSMFMLIASEIGLIGLLCFLMFLKYLRGSLVFLAVILGLALFDHYFWTLQQGGFMFWGLLAIFFRDTITT